MNFKRINNITGWVICLIACAVYIMTMEATGSLWDCGEFASGAYKLQIPHSPGAPFFVLIGRIFMSPFSPHDAATGINLMSALASGFTILFLFWTITHLARKIVQKEDASLSNQNIIGIMLAGAIGALAYTFSDTFWYSAVEGEVYALSSFFTGLLFWMMLKWENNVSDEQAMGITGHFTRADRWIIAIFLVMGLSIGVHLLNLLTIPSIVMIYYFKRYKVTKWKTFYAFVIGCVITGFVQKALIQWTIKAAGNLDVMFVNSFNLPFFSGFAFYFIAVAALLIVGIRFKEDNLNKTRLGIWLAVLITFLIFPAVLYSGSEGLAGKIILRLLGIGIVSASVYFIKASNLRFLKLSLWCFLFISLGCFGSYFTTLVRSNANVALDMNEVDNPINLMSYLSREQYGDWPILFGQDFTDHATDTKLVDTYVKGKTKYELAGKKLEAYVYPAGSEHVFPRMWDQSNDQGRADYYAAWMGLEQNRDGSYKKDENGNYLRESGEVAKPTMGENIAFFLQYQMGWMYFRYFMWNFSGKQDDNQGVYMSNVRDGNWKTGIGFLDKMRLGDQSTLPDSLKHNKANNNLFMLPLILGILGIIYQYKKDKRDLLTTFLLFLFTGIAIGVYLNMAGNQPRERDYAFVGSFYAFAIWIGLGVLYVRDLLTGPLKNPRMATIIAGTVCMLAVPVLMANQEWDDHDRSHKTIARDLASDYLQSCAKDAILITFGDNDTYPLWYAQEVEGIRPDIRVINSSLLGTDWYINQLRYKVNESAPIDVIWAPEQIEGSKRDVVRYNPNSGIDKNASMDLYTMMKDYAGSDDAAKGAVEMEGDIINTFPTHNVTVPVDINLVKQNGTVNADDSVVSALQFSIPKNYLYKNDGAILNIIAANKWKRPIYFTSPYGELGFQGYLRQDGLTFRLVPVLTGGTNQNWVMDKMMNKFMFGSAEKPGVYYDEENRRHLGSIRLAYAQAANDLANSGRMEDCKKLLNKCDKMMLEENFAYGMTGRSQQHNQISMQFLYAAYKCGDTVLAAKVSKSLKEDMEQQATYYQGLPTDKRDALGFEEQRNGELLKGIYDMEQRYKERPAIPENPVPVNSHPDSTPKKDSP